MQTLDLPTPTADEAEQSQKLCEHIKQKIAEAGGWIDFEQYMQLALYAPGLGYYSGGRQKFGEQGDFITSPEVSPLFAQTLARPVAQLLKKITRASIIEFGAGSGKLAVDLLQALQIVNQLPDEYLIIELSAELQQRQQEVLQQRVPELVNRVRWLTQLPEKPLNAIVIANEVLDAMPVKRFLLDANKAKLLGVEVCEKALKLSYSNIRNRHIAVKLICILFPGSAHCQNVLIRERYILLITGIRAVNTIRRKGIWGHLWGIIDIALSMHHYGIPGCRI